MPDPRHYIIREIDGNAQLLDWDANEDKARAKALAHRKQVPAHRVVLASVRFAYVDQPDDQEHTPVEAGADGGGALAGMAPAGDAGRGEDVRPVSDETPGQPAGTGLEPDAEREGDAA